MATRNNPMAGRYFNDPNLAVAMSSLASAFAPPGAEDYLVAEKIRGTRTQNDALTDLYAQAGNDPDSLAYIADLYDPVNGIGARNMADATARAKIEAENARALEQTRMEGLFGLAGQTLNYDQGMPGLSPDIAAAIGVPAMPPTTGAALGVVPPLMDESEMKAAILGRQSPEDQRAAALAGVDLVQTDRGGVATYSLPIDAVGQPAYNNQGGKSPSDLVNYRTADGREGSGVFDPSTGVLTDVATGAALPEGTMTFKLQGGDKNAMVGGTTANQTNWNNQLAEAEFGLLRAAEFRNLLETNPGVLGVAGTVQGFAQSAIQGLSDVAALAGGPDTPIGSINDLNDMIAETAKVAGWNSQIAQARAMALEMAYYDIKSQDPGGEVNVRELERVLGQYMGGFAGNQPVLDVLKVTEGRLALRRDLARQNLRQETGGAGAPAAVPGQPGTPQRMRFDANGDPIP